MALIFIRGTNHTQHTLTLNTFLYTLNFVSLLSPFFLNPLAIPFLLLVFYSHTSTFFSLLFYIYEMEAIATAPSPRREGVLRIPGLADSGGERGDSPPGSIGSPHDSVISSADRPAAF